MGRAFLGVVGIELDPRSALADADGFQRGGGLALAWSDANPPGQAGDASCLLSGRIDSLHGLSERLGLDTVDQPEQLVATGYQRLGPGLLDELRGNFALVIWSGGGAEVLLAVDQLGSRSLLLHQRGGGAIFGSEVRDVIRLLPTRPSPCDPAVVAWLAGGPIDPGRTLYEGVDRLAGGTYARLERGRWERRTYWRPSYRPRSRLPREAIVQELRAGVDLAVARRLPAGAGTAGILLSGGLDSSSVAATAVASPRGRESVGGFYSALFPLHPSTDESSLVTRLESELKVPVSRLLVRSGSMLAAALEYLRQWAVPTPSPTLFFQRPLLARAANDGVTTLLDGQGGDELFAAARYLLADQLRRGRLVSLCELARRLPGYQPASRGDLRQLVREYALKGALPEQVHRLARRLRGADSYAWSWLTPAGARFALEADPWAWKNASGPRWWAAKADELTAGRERAGVADLLRRKFSDAGLAGAHPFLHDLDLIELVLALPPVESFDPRFDRPLLREAMRGRVPDEVRLRPEKSYFDALFRDCLTGADAPALERLLSAPDAEINRYVQSALVRDRLLRAPPERRTGGWCWTAWRLASIECWLRLQHDGAFVDRALSGWNLAPLDSDFEPAFGAAD